MQKSPIGEIADNFLSVFPSIHIYLFPKNLTWFSWTLGAPCRFITTFRIMWVLNWYKKPLEFWRASSRWVQRIKKDSSSPNQNFLNDLHRFQFGKSWESEVWNSLHWSSGGKNWRIGWNLRGQLCLRLSENRSPLSCLLFPILFYSSNS